MRVKAQMWFADFVIASVIASLMVISYYTYTTNLSKEDVGLLDELVADTKTVSSSLTSAGYPANWDTNTVTRIGFTDNYNRIDNDKFGEFVKINYNKSKKLLGTIYDYFLFFVNESGDVQNIEGYCGTGNADALANYDINAAYYYEGDTAGGESFLKSFMEDEFDAVVYCESDPKCSTSLFFSDFLSDINGYDFIVVEHPTWSNSDFNSFEGVADPWVTAGGTLFVGGELGSSQNSNGFGVQFKKISGQSESDRLATVVNEDEFIAFNLEDNIRFSQAYYVVDIGPDNDLKDIARFNESDIELADILDNKIALARWSFNTGNIFFFSDFDADYLSGNFQQILEGSLKKNADAECLPINISNVQRENLVRDDRLLIYNSNRVKMVLYLWQ